MSESPYLVCLALAEQNGKRIMPIGGKALKEPIRDLNCPPSVFENITLEILLRLIERSEVYPIRRLYNENSILIIQIPLESLQKELPSVKQNWINTGDSDNFLMDLKKLCNGVWSSNFVRYEGIKYKQI